MTISESLPNLWGMFHLSLIVITFIETLNYIAIGNFVCVEKGGRKNWGFAIK